LYRYGLDGREYAIKKVRMATKGGGPVSPAAAARVLREVATLSRLEHTAVVRYNQAWVEEAPKEPKKGAAGRLSASSGEGSSDEADAWGVGETTGETETPRGTETGETGTETGTGMGTRTGTRTSGGGGGGGGGAAAVIRGKRREQPESPTGNGTVMWLHIQMEYCRANLGDVLSREAAAGTEVDEERAWAWMRQVLEGLAHIHAQGIAHRDLKPGNIFVDARGFLKIGDFGLAKFQDAAPDASPAREAGDGGGGADDAGGATEEGGRAAKKKGDGERVEKTTPDGGGGGDPEQETTGAVGTYLYTAPEVEAGWVNQSSKVDLYSAGIVFFEMLRRFSTGMERAVGLSQVEYS
jgi:translation initiation factor 2-alpha kinase 4